MTPEESFWGWFLRHEDDLFCLDQAREEDREKLFDGLADQISNVDSDLTFELGPKSAKREFVISAAGIKRAFPFVVALMNAAPHLDRWCVIAFRPRRPVKGIVEFRGRQVDVKDVKFSLLVNGTTVGIYLYIPGYKPEDFELKQIGYLMLDEALGEYDVESRVGLIKMLPSVDNPESDQYSLSDLPRLFDQLVAQLEGRPVNPS